MNKTALVFGIGASFILAAGAANAAGTCAADVAALQQQVGMDEGANATIGATDPGVQQPDPSASVDTSTSTTGANGEVAAGTANQDNNANATIGATDPGVQQPDPSASSSTTTNSTTTGTGTTADSSTDGNTMPTNNENSGANATIGATDPGVQQPQNTDPVADANDSNSTGTSSTTVGSGTVTETSRVGDMNTSAGGRAEAITALKKAQLAADAGDESTCMTELGNAKAAMGVQ
jgi:hypothetical protein